MYDMNSFSNRLDFDISLPTQQISYKYVINKEHRLTNDKIKEEYAGVTDCNSTNKRDFDSEFDREISIRIAN